MVKLSWFVIVIVVSVVFLNMLLRGVFWLICGCEIDDWVLFCWRFMCWIICVVMVLSILILLRWRIFLRMK